MHQMKEQNQFACSEKKFKFLRIRKIKSFPKKVNFEKLPPD